MGSGKNHSAKVTCVRSLNVPGWNRPAQETTRERALKLRIEADLLAAVCVSVRSSQIWTLTAQPQAAGH
jgi:hypothetical protein